VGWKFLSELIRINFSILVRESCYEFVEIDFAISVNICNGNQVIDFIVIQINLLALEEFFEFYWSNFAISVSVNLLESLSKLMNNLRSKFFFNYLMRSLRKNRSSLLILLLWILEITWECFDKFIKIDFSISV
jgi:hypothetical protein